MSKILPAPDALVGKRIDVALSKMLGISRAKAGELIDSGQASLLDRSSRTSSVFGNLAV